MKLKSKILIGFGMLMLIFMFVIVWNYLFLNNTSQSIGELVDEKFTTEKYIQDSNVIILNIHAEIWDTMLFNISHRESAIEEMNGIAKRFYQNVKDLKEHIPDKEEDFESLNSIFRAYYMFGSAILNLKDIDEFMEKVDTVNKFKENKEKLIAILDDAVSASKAEFEAALVDLNDSFTFASILNAGLTIGVILIALIISFIISGMLTKPIVELTEVATKVREGDLHIRTNVKTKDEIKVLGNTFNDMLDRIQEYNEHLEDLVAQRTEELRKSNEELAATNALIKKQLKMAQKIQEALIPKKLPNNEEISLSGSYIPMEDLGGDFYDVFHITDDQIGVVIADVSGHGVPAALVTAMAKISFSTNSIPGRSTSEIVDLVNKELCVAIGGVKQYLTAFYCIIDTKKGVIDFTNAGHNEIYLIRATGEMVRLMPNSKIIGFRSKFVFKTDSVTIAEGDKLVMYTDGIPEAMNADKGFYGEKRFENLVQENSTMNCKAFVTKVFEDINHFRGDFPAQDDITLLVADINSEPGGLKIDLEVTVPAEDEPGIIEDDETAKVVRDVLEIYDKARTMFKSGQYEEVYALLQSNEDKLRRKTDKINFYNLCASAQYKLNNIAEAKKYWNMALEIDPKNRKLLYNIESINEN